MRYETVKESQREIKRQLKATEKQIEGLLDRLVETDSSTLISAYETRLAKLEKEKIVLSEKVEKALPKQGRLEECIELALKFLSSPWKAYKNGDYTTRQLVLRLAFQEPLSYCRNTGYGTPNFFPSFQGVTGNFRSEK